MRTIISRLPPQHRVSTSGRIVLQRGLNIATHLKAGSRPMSVGPAEASARYPMNEPLPELPLAPRYPCPFIIESDIQNYLVPLYRTGWGISRTPSASSDAKITPPATQLSKRIVLPSADMAGIFMKDVLSTITERENHHPVWDVEDDTFSTDIHIHTHTALAPDGRQNADDQAVFARKRPGITLRDIRYAILFEGLLRDYVHHGFIEPNLLTAFPQHTDIDLVHNFRALQAQN